MARKNNSPFPAMPRSKKDKETEKKALEDEKKDFEQRIENGDELTKLELKRLEDITTRIDNLNKSLALMYTRALKSNRTKREVRGLESSKLNRLLQDLEEAKQRGDEAEIARKEAEIIEEKEKMDDKKEEYYSQQREHRGAESSKLNRLLQDLEEAKQRGDEAEIARKEAEIIEEKEKMDDKKEEYNRQKRELRGAESSKLNRLLQELEEAKQRGDIAEIAKKEAEIIEEKEKMDDKKEERKRQERDRRGTESSKLNRLLQDLEEAKQRGDIAEIAKKEAEIIEEKEKMDDKKEKRKRQDREQRGAESSKLNRLLQDLEEAKQRGDIAEIAKKEAEIIEEKEKMDDKKEKRNRKQRELRGTESSEMNRLLQDLEVAKQRGDEAEIAKIKVEISKEKEKMDMKKEEYYRQRRERNGLESREMDRLQKELEEAKLRGDEAEIAKIKVEISKEKEKMDMKQEEYYRQQRERKGLESREMDRLQKELEEAKLRGDEAEIAKIKAEISKEKEKMDTINEDYNRRQRERRGTESSEMNRLLQELEEAKLRGDEAEIAKIKVEISKEKEKMDMKKEEYYRQRRERNGLESREMDRLQKELEEAKLRGDEAEIAKIKVEISKEKEKMDMKKEECNRRQREYKGLESREMDRLQKELEAAKLRGDEAEIAKIKEEISKEQEKMDDKKAKYKTAYLRKWGFISPEKDSLQKKLLEAIEKGDGDQIKILTDQLIVETNRMKAMQAELKQRIRYNLGIESEEKDKLEKKLETAKKDCNEAEIRRLETAIQQAESIRLKTLEENQKRYNDFIGLDSSRMENLLDQKASAIADKDNAKIKQLDKKIVEEQKQMRKLSESYQNNCRVYRGYESPEKDKLEKLLEDAKKDNNEAEIRRLEEEIQREIGNMKERRAKYLQKQRVYAGLEIRDKEKLEHELKEAKKTLNIERIKQAESAINEAEKEMHTVHEKRKKERLIRMGLLNPKLEELEDQLIIAIVSNDIPKVNFLTPRIELEKQEISRRIARIQEKSLIKRGLLSARLIELREDLKTHSDQQEIEFIEYQIEVEMLALAEQRKKYLEAVRLWNKRRREIVNKFESSLNPEDKPNHRRFRFSAREWMFAARDGNECILCKCMVPRGVFWVHKSNHRVCLDLVLAGPPNSRVIQKIENMTRNTDPGWNMCRMNIITGTRAHKIARNVSANLTWIAYGFNAVSGSAAKLDHMQRGNDLEPIVMMMYMSFFNIKEEEVHYPCGLIRHGGISILACTPDSLIRDDGQTEFKCPIGSPQEFIAKYNTLVITYGPRFGKFIGAVPPEIHGDYMLNPNDKYHTQVCMQLLCTGRAYCDIVFLFRRESVIYKQEILDADVWNKYINSTPSEVYLWVQRLYKEDAQEHFKKYQGNYIDFYKNHMVSKTLWDDEKIPTFNPHSTPYLPREMVYNKTNKYAGVDQNFALGLRKGAKYVDNDSWNMDIRPPRRQTTTPKKTNQLSTPLKSPFGSSSFNITSQPSTYGRSTRSRNRQREPSFDDDSSVSSSRIMEEQAETEEDDLSEGYDSSSEDDDEIRDPSFYIALEDAGYKYRHEGDGVEIFDVTDDIQNEKIDIENGDPSDIADAILNEVFPDELSDTEDFENQDEFSDTEMFENSDVDDDETDYSLYSAADSQDEQMSSLDDITDIMTVQAIKDSLNPPASSTGLSQAMEQSSIHQNIDQSSRVSSPIQSPRDQFKTPSKPRTKKPAVAPNPAVSPRTAKTSGSTTKRSTKSSTVSSGQHTQSVSFSNMGAAAAECMDTKSGGNRKSTQSSQFDDFDPTKDPFRDSLKVGLSTFRVPKTKETSHSTSRQSPASKAAKPSATITSASYSQAPAEEMDISHDDDFMPSRHKSKSDKSDDRRVMPTRIPMASANFPRPSKSEEEFADTEEIEPQRAYFGNIGKRKHISVKPDNVESTHRNVGASKSTKKRSKPSATVTKPENPHSDEEIVTFEYKCTLEPGRRSTTRSAASHMISLAEDVDQMSALLLQLNLETRQVRRKEICKQIDKLSTYYEQKRKGFKENATKVSSNKLPAQNTPTVHQTKPPTTVEEYALEEAHKAIRQLSLHPYKEQSVQQTPKEDSSKPSFLKRIKQFFTGSKNKIEKQAVENVVEYESSESESEVD